MDRLDSSLDDIIKAQKAAKKHQLQKKPKNASATAASIPPKTAKPIRTADLKRQVGKVGKVGKIGRIGKASKTPYARPTTQKMESELFTETYKALNAPVKEIFTAGYLPRTQPVKLIAINTKASKKGGAVSAAPSQSIRLTVTQETKKTQDVSANSPKSQQTSNGRGNDYHSRIPTGPRVPESLSSSAASLRDREQRERERERERGERGRASYREADSYRPNRNDRYDSATSISSSAYNGNHNNGRGKNSRRESPPPSRRDLPADMARRNGPRENNYSGSSTSNGSSNNINSSNSNINLSNVRVADRISRPESNIAPAINSRLSPEPVKPEIGTDDMEIDDVLIRGAAAPGSPDVSFRGESGPVTIEIENLDPGTTAEDVKFVCSRYGEIKTCVCSRGFAQVTYARRAAGLAAVDGLHGKRADNGQILRVTMRKHAVIHDVTSSGAAHTPTPIAGPMALLHKAVNGTLQNANTLYSDQLVAAQHMLKVQQHRMAQLQAEEQRIAQLRLHAGQTAPRF